MRVEQVVLRLVKARLSRPFENRWQRFETWTKLVVRVDAGSVAGFGECSAMETPFYNYETVETAWHIVERYLAPIVLTAGDASAETAAAEMRRVNGHEEAKGALECALWDLRARALGSPLCVELGGRRRPVAVGATVGIEPSIPALVAAVGRAHEAGYRRVRIKIRPGWDLEPLCAVRSAFPRLPLIADANAAYGPGDADSLRRLDDLDLLALEQPFGHTMIDEAASLQRRLQTPICLDESVKSAADARAAIRRGACRMINIKVGRVGGLGEAIRIHDLCYDEGVPAFVGAKYDLGIGRWTNLALATLPGMSQPSDVGPSSRYYVDDGARPSLELSEPGLVEPLPSAGIGAHLTEGLETVRELALGMRPNDP
jgi:O-succinylbenzoate synthase